LLNYPFSPHQWILAIVAALCLGLSKTGFTGIALLGVALMAEVWPARESTGIILPMLVFGDIFAVTLFNQHALWKEVWRVLPPALVGVVIGFALFRILPAPIFAPVIGWIVLVLVSLQAWQRTAGAKALARMSADPIVVGQETRPNSASSEAHAIVAWPLGALAGITTMLANAAGPVMTIYLLAARLAKYEFMGTSSWLFFLINLFKLPFSYALGVINLRSLGFNLLMLPAVALGAMSGKWLLRLVPQLWFDRLLLLSAAFAAVRLIWH
jgi:uncharacterized protein